MPNEKVTLQDLKRSKRQSYSMQEVYYLVRSIPVTGWNNFQKVRTILLYNSRYCNLLAKVGKGNGTRYYVPKETVEKFLLDIKNGII